MSLLTEQEIYAMADDGVFLGNIKEITRAIESAVIEKIKAQERDALAAQNQQMRRALTYIGGHIRLSRLFACEGGDSYDPECADLNIDKAESFANEALALPDLANPVLNREKSNILREAATHWSGDGNIPERVVKLWLDDMADAIEKGDLVSGREEMKLPALNPGETYVGGYTLDGVTLIHTILLPGDKDDGNWQNALDWAKSIGGDLPNRIEQAMLFAGFKDLFQKDWYWSNATVDGDDAYAWFQYFGNGEQNDGHKDDNYCRARAVRRVEVTL